MPHDRVPEEYIKCPRAAELGRPFTRPPRPGPGPRGQVGPLCVLPNGLAGNLRADLFERIWPRPLGGLGARSPRGVGQPRAAPLLQERALQGLSSRKGQDAREGRSPP